MLTGISSFADWLTNNNNEDDLFSTINQVNDTKAKAERKGEFKTLMAVTRLW